MEPIRELLRKQTNDLLRTGSLQEPVPDSHPKSKVTLPSCSSLACKQRISKNGLRNFFLKGSNIKLDWRMNWFDIQQWKWYLKNVLDNFCQLWYKPTLWLKDKLIWLWSKVTATSCFMNEVFQERLQGEMNKYISNFGTNMCLSWVMNWLHFRDQSSSSLWPHLPEIYTWVWEANCVGLGGQRVCQSCFGTTQVSPSSWPTTVPSYFRCTAIACLSWYY